MGRLVALFASVVAALGLAAIVAWVVAIGWKPG
ncbi:MAG: glycosyl hydrolase, partial [Lysobacteraceae bacterium]